MSFNLTLVKSLTLSPIRSSGSFWSLHVELFVVTDTALTGKLNYLISVDPFQPQILWFCEITFSFLSKLLSKVIFPGFYK